MNSKLEERLTQYEQSTPISSNQDLLHAVESILKEEESKKATEQNIDLIDEAIETILTLKGIDIDQLNCKADAVAAKIIDDVHKNDVTESAKRRNSVRVKWIVPIAAILFMLISATLIAYAMGYDILGMTGEAFNQLKQKIWHDNGNTSIIITDTRREYVSYEAMIENEGYANLLWPHTIAEGNYIGDICVEDYAEYREIAFSFNYGESVCEFSLCSSSENPYYNRELVQIGKLGVILSEYDKIYQAEFYYEENLYVIKASSYETLETVLNNLEVK